MICLVYTSEKCVYFSIGHCVDCGKSYHRRHSCEYNQCKCCRIKKRNVRVDNQKINCDRYDCFCTSTKTIYCVGCNGDGLHEYDCEYDDSDDDIKI